MRLLWVFLLALPALAADIAVAPQSLAFAFELRSNVLPPQGIVLTSPQPFAFTASRPPADRWLVLPSGTAALSTNGPVFIPVTADPTGLNPGTYTSAITLRFGQGGITIPVTLLVSFAPILAASPALVGFDPAVQTLQVAFGLSSGQGFVANPTTSTPWLSVRGASGQLFVSANPSVAGPGLSAGSFQVQATAAVPGGIPNNPLTVPVVNMGSGFASPPPLTLNPTELTFSGSASRQVAVTGGTFTASDDAPWLTESVAGQTLTVSADAAGLAPGTYSATVTLNASGVLQFLPVTLTFGPPALTKVANAASYAEGAISPGEVLVLGGSNLGPAALAGLTLDADGSVSTTLAGVRVLVNGVAAPMIYATATQLSAVAPYDLDGRTTAAIQVVVNGQTSNTLNVPVASAVPGIFTANSAGTGPAAVLRVGDIIAIYMTGEGKTNPAGVNGRVTIVPPVPVQNVTATLDGQPAEVTFAGEAPGIVSGVMQMNLRVPAGVRAGEVPLAVSVGGTPSQNGVTVSAR
jgi:uncharacterized protein (TIGR03437 family)